MYRKLAIVIQAATFVGMLVVAAVTWHNESTNELRAEMREGFQAIRAEMKREHEAIRNDIHDLNGRLGRVEGQLRILTQERE